MFSKKLEIRTICISLLIGLFIVQGVMGQKKNLLFIMTDQQRR